MTTFKANRKFPNPATVTDDPRSHTLALQQVIEALNIGQRRTKEINSSYVRVHELVDVGLIEVVGNQLKLTNLGQSVAAGSSTLAGLTDVDLTGLSDGDILVYDSGTATWIVQAPSSGAITGADMYDVSLNDLADVGFSAPEDGDALTYDAATGLWTARDVGSLGIVHDGVQLRRTSAQSVAQATTVTIQWEVEDRDDNNYWTSGSNTRITIPVSGWYSMGCLIEWPASVGDGYLQLHLNGTRISYDYEGAVGSQPQHFNEIRYLTAGDYIEWTVYHTTGGTISLVGPATIYPKCWLHRLAVASSPANPINDGAHVYRNASAQSISTGTTVAVTFDTEARDDGGYATLGTHDTRLTVPQAGWYIIVGNVNWSVNATGTRYCNLRKNGASNIAADVRPTGAGDPAQVVSTLAYLAANDYIELTVSQSSGSTLTLLVGNNMPSLQLHRLATPPESQAAVVLRTTDQTLTAGVWAAVSWDTEEWDTGAFWSGGAADRFVIAATGLYTMDLNVRFYSTSTSGERSIGISKNGLPGAGGVDLGSIYRTAGVPVSAMCVSATRKLVAGDYVMGCAYSSISSDGPAGTTYTVSFAIRRVG